MQLLSYQHLKGAIATTTAALVMLANPLVQAQPVADPALTQVVQALEDPVHYLANYPWLGLLMDEVTYGPITVSNVRFNNGSRLAVVKPGEEVHGSLRYRVDSTNQTMFNRYHLAVGLKGIGAQDCVTHTYGIWDSKGKGDFTLNAPLQPGVYEVRIFYQDAPTCEEARSVWNDAIGDPSSFATIGVIIVEPAVNPACPPLVKEGEEPLQYLATHPWIGLLMNEVTYGPITVADVHFNTGTRLTAVQPGEIIHGNLRYRVDSTTQNMFHRYHLVVGLKGIGAQDCVTHTYGVWDSKGKGSFTLKAPLQPGVYEVRFTYQEAPTCEEVRSVWNREGGEPSSFATIGAIIVR